MWNASPSSRRSTGAPTTSTDNPLWLLPLPLPVAALSAALVVSGIANGLVNPCIHAIMTLRVPSGLRPAVMSSMTTVWALASPLGLFGAGPVLDAFGARPVLVAFAGVQTVAMGVVAAALLRARARRGVEIAAAAV